MRCVQVAFRDAEPCDRYILLSGQDYPIAARARIAEFFAKNPDKEFVEAFPRDVKDAGAPDGLPTIGLGATISGWVTDVSRCHLSARDCHRCRSITEALGGP